MLRRQIDNRPIREDPLHLALEVRPFNRPVEIIEGQRAAAQQELAQNGDLVVLGIQVPGSTR